MSDSKQIMPTAQLPPDPLADVWAVVVPLLMPERAETLLNLTKNWVKEELQTYSALHHTDDVQLGIELTNARAKFDLPDVGPMEVIGYRLVLTMTGDLPPHPVTEVDCFFVQNPVSKLLDNVILSKANPGQGERLQ